MSRDYDGTDTKVACDKSDTCILAIDCEDAKPHYYDEWGSSQSGGPFYCDRNGFRCKKTNQFVKCVEKKE